MQLCDKVSSSFPTLTRVTSFSHNVYTTLIGCDRSGLDTTQWCHQWGACGCICTQSVHQYTP